MIILILMLSVVIEDGSDQVLNAKASVVIDPSDI